MSPDRAISDDDNPEITQQDFARAKRGDDIQAAIRAAFRRSPLENGASIVKEQVTIRLDRDVVARFRATGPGWQDRVNDVLRRASA